MTVARLCLRSGLTDLWLTITPVFKLMPVSVFVELTERLGDEIVGA